MLTESEKQRVLLAFDKLNNAPCLSCGGLAYEVADGIGVIPLRSASNYHGPYSGVSMPVIFRVCNGCGHATPYALRPLGLMDLIPGAT